LELKNLKSKGDEAIAGRKNSGERERKFRKKGAHSKGKKTSENARTNRRKHNGERWDNYSVKNLPEGEFKSTEDASRETI